jgi:hypothetical protein
MLRFKKGNKFKKRGKFKRVLVLMACAYSVETVPYVGHFVEKDRCDAYGEVGLGF